MNSQERLKELEERLQKLDADRVTLLRELHTLREEVSLKREAAKPLLGRSILKQDLSTNSGKVQLFIELFRAREEVFPKRWENPKTGKLGYAPACVNEWIKPICQKPNIKCGGIH